MISYPRYRTFVFVILIAAFSPTALFAQVPMPVSYDLKAEINPAAGSLSVRGRIELPLNQLRHREISFGLHETFEVKALSVNGHKASVSFRSGEYTPINPATRNVVVSLPSAVSGDRALVEIEYAGRLKGIPEFGTFPDQKEALDDQINPRLVELAYYSSWYPQFFAFSYPLRIELEVSLPVGWKAICSGKKLEESIQAGRAVTRWSSPKDVDIVITAAPNYKEKSHRLPAGEIDIYYTQLPDEFVEGEVRQLADTMKLFTDKLGETVIPGGTVKHVYSPKHKGQGRAGMARPGIIVTSEGLILEALREDPKYSLFQDIAHEIAHFWWDLGAGQGDWINEAFAEYFSAVAVQKLISQQQFEGVLENYRKEVRDLPASAPSISVAPFGGESFVVRYYKGALMVDYLRQTLGEQKFFNASRKFFEKYKGKSIGTAEFRSFWKEMLGDQKGSLDVWLDSPGGLPDLDRKPSKNSAASLQP